MFLALEISSSNVLIQGSEVLERFLSIVKLGMVNAIVDEIRECRAIIVCSAIGLSMYLINCPGRCANILIFISSSKSAVDPTFNVILSSCLMVFVPLSRIE